MSEPTDAVRKIVTMVMKERSGASRMTLGEWEAFLAPVIASIRNAALEEAAEGVSDEIRDGNIAAAAIRRLKGDPNRMEAPPVHVSFDGPATAVHPYTLNGGPVFKETPTRPRHAGADVSFHDPHHPVTKSACK